MALIKCPDCAKKVSDKADVCIYCGCPLKVKNEDKFPKVNKHLNNNMIFIVVILIVITIIGFIGFSYYLQEKDMVEVPNLVLASEENGVDLLIANDLVPNVTYEYSDTVEEGVIISISPDAGTKVRENSTVDVVVSKGPQTVWASDATIHWNNISSGQDSWGFATPYISDEYLYIECEPIFRTSFSWKDGGFGVASITDTFSKKVPVNIIIDQDEVKADEKQSITLKVSTKDLDVSKPTTLHMELIGVKDNRDISIEISFSISW